ncbi:MAG: hypothetical protein ACLUHE_02630 [Christensenellales bacterium]
MNDEPKSGKNVKNVNKNARNVFDNMGSYAILMLNRYIRKSNKNTFGGMKNKTFYCIHPFGSHVVERPCARLCGGGTGREEIHNC